MVEVYFQSLLFIGKHCKHDCDLGIGELHYIALATVISFTFLDSCSQELRMEAAKANIMCILVLHSKFVPKILYMVVLS